MSSSVANVRVEPMNVFWKAEEKETFDFTNATAAGAGGKHIKLYLPTGAKYYVWFDENNTDTDPAPATFTAIAVDYGAGALATAIATAFQVAVDAVSGFTATISGDVVTVVRDAVGDVTDSVNVDATEIVMTKVQDGKNVDLGLIDGDIEISTDPKTFELKAHQHGETILSELIQGFGCSIGLTLLESDNTLRKSVMIGAAGDAVTPSGGTEVYGIGTSKIGSNKIIDAARLILHPVSAGSTDYTRDWCFWKAGVVVESITFSGTDPEKMKVSFKCYPDDSKSSKVSIFAVGDHTQAGI
jgi:hypothetical protein